jgi:hypothetical protein
LRHATICPALPTLQGHLTEHHRCPRSPARKLFEISLAALVGGLMQLVMSLVDPQGQMAVDGVLVGGRSRASASIDGCAGESRLIPVNSRDRVIRAAS